MKVIYEYLILNEVNIIAIESEKFTKFTNIIN